MTAIYTQLFFTEAGPSGEAFTADKYVVRLRTVYTF